MVELHLGVRVKQDLIRKHFFLKFNKGLFLQRYGSMKMLVIILKEKVLSGICLVNLLMFSTLLSLLD